MTKTLLMTAVTVATCGFFALHGQGAAPASAMPVAQQNALVKKYCAVCHTDASMNGGLSLEHFDAAHPDPGVAAMLVSKLTSGLTPKQVLEARNDPGIATMIDGKMKTGAMGAAGLGVPDRATQDALLSALSAEATGADHWTLNRTQNAATASVLREVPSVAYPGDTDMYRLTLTCRLDTHQAEMQLAWAPGVPPTGQAMSVAVDGKAPFTYKAEGSEKMGNGTETTSGPGAIVLFSTPLPAQTLTIRNLFPDETVVFSFGDLTPAMRQELSTCFTASPA